MNSDKYCKTCVNYLLFCPNRCPQGPMLFPLLAMVPPPKLCSIMELPINPPYESMLFR